jgi:hypothetical protein
MKERLSPTERLHLTLSHQQPDRPPIDFSAVASVCQQLSTCAGGRAITDMLHVDFRHVFPRYMGVMPAVPEGCTGVDMWGTGYLTTAACPQHVAYFPWAQVETMEQVAQLHFPTIDDYDFSSIAEHCRRCEPYVVSFGHAVRISDDADHPFRLMPTTCFT